MNIYEDIVYLLENYYKLFLDGLISTLVLAIIGTVVGLFLGVFLAFGKGIKINRDDSGLIKILKYPIVIFCNVYSTVIRGTPMMVQAMIFKYGCQILFGINWNLILPGKSIFNGWLIAGLIVITFNTAAYMGEIVRSGLNGVGNDQIEGAKSLGLSPIKTLFLVSLPQALRNSLPTIGNEWIVNIKDSSVLNVIGVTELFFQAGQAANRNYKYVATYIIVAAIYLICTLFATGTLKLIEIKMDGKKIKIPWLNLKNKHYSTPNNVKINVEIEYKDGE